MRVTAVVLTDNQYLERLLMKLHTPRAGSRIALVAATGLILGLSACSTETASSGASTLDGQWSDSSVRNEEQLKGTVYDPTQVHTFAVEYSEDDYAKMLASYNESETKEWIQASITIDGQAFEKVGLRLKGNSSLRSLSDDVEGQDVPWLIRLDKYVTGQNLDGFSEFVIRSNNTQTALNEAVAQTLFAEAGLASQAPIAVRFSVNGSTEVLRLAVENPSDEWDADQFDTTGLLFKAEADGDYSYRGDDPASYEDVFDQETDGDNLNYEPLINFLQFINESDDETFASELPTRFDVEAFAAYLAMQDLVDNFDDIDGPGNNSYLRWDQESGVFTLVNWDLNLAFGGSPGGGVGGGRGGGQGGGIGGGQRPENFDPDNLPEGFDPGDMPEGFTPGEIPEGFDPGDLPEPPTGAAQGQRPQQGGPGGGGMNRSNILKERFLANTEFNQLYKDAAAALSAQLIDSERALQVLDQWSQVLSTGVQDLVSTATIAGDSAKISGYLSGTESAESDKDSN